MNCRKEILKAFNIQKGQRFKIRYNGTLLSSVYHFDEKLNCVNGDETFICFTLQDLIESDRVEFEPLPFWTQEDKIIFQYAKLCGMRWLAVDKLKNTYAFRNKPVRMRDFIWGDPNENCVPICHELSCLTWDDEPLDLDTIDI